MVIKGIMASKRHHKRIRDEYKLIRENIIETLGGKCMRCGTEEVLSLHHIIPVCFGADNRIMNLVLVCLNKKAGNCHWKENGRSYRWVSKNRGLFFNGNSLSSIIEKARKELYPELV